MTSFRFVFPCLLILLIGCDQPQATIVSNPPAAVWDGDELLGQTPLALPPPEKGLELTLRAPGYQDATVTVPSGTQKQVKADLAPVGGHTLTCTSTPTGASVFLDGELMGETPLTIRDLDRDAVEVTFRKKNHEQVARAVGFGTAATQNLVVVLPNLTEKYYRQRLLNEPQVLHHYCDLGHHYVLAHDFQSAVDVFARGVDLVVRNPSAPDASRLWSEIDRLTSEQYDYGDTVTVTRARKILADRLGRLLKTHGAKSPVALYTSFIAVLDTLNQRQRAREVFGEAWKRYPNDRTLRRVAKQRHFTLP
ncbi:MAG: PEGA domain-containing protein [Victivallales bacterium]|nr:PEGA domain-containing protein [Victivallales bacterium]